MAFDGAQLDAVDTEITGVLGDRLITPDDVRGSAADLRTAVQTTGWPTVADSRGKFLFFMDNANKRDLYLQGHPSLQGRAMFTSSGEGQPDGAVLKVNDPGDGSRIRALVEAGYLVRTRADADVVSPDPADPRHRTRLGSSDRAHGLPRRRIAAVDRLPGVVRDPGRRTLQPGADHRS